jgi:hypothetical protein
LTKSGAWCSILPRTTNGETGHAENDNMLGGFASLSERQPRLKEDHLSEPREKKRL